ncbi:lysine N(6)-hydroxylase/L-ornithine N(5)-oxygenase family protein [Paraburkholderia bonniea]|uniref:lysine N(6)-hydroxylase/L-ornithine N(5)-oxygenase family protein n=1 Tax=Paraburkholderia bonniea TaxID=2152891 RepID=UPI0015806F09|nr:lysine N(6)-hydroxylase/L-ornithine N(5)-oxygenase family protein [Paraburkholderia bonniea]WJF92171.1 lysine N(6)-hydroxylase/L-ornithine N(5)-oxygenase family protein [Paraburkholderia bonniea]WJF95491.1 lysine N(6)-hydroxylase/L-ornithine N(5)-oxygenase family protein [Paraburkholderia bonniea]
MQREPVHDLIGVGFGPSNLALAVRLAERRNAAPAAHCFIEAQAEFGWHRGMLLDDSRMQISFLKDLVTLRDPKSPFTFINYLFERGRLQDFVNLKNFYPTRVEFHDYLRWVANAFDDQVHYGERVTAIEPVMAAHDASVVTQLRVFSRAADGRERQRLTRALSVGMGGTPQIPPAFAALREAPVLHSSRYLTEIDQYLGNPVRRQRVAVVGSGQSAAEVFIDLTRRYPQVDATLVMRAPVLKPADDSPFVNEIFSPAFTDLVYAQPRDARQSLIDTFRDTNYSVVDRPLIEQIYELLYVQSVSQSPRHRLLPNCALEAVQHDSGDSRGVLALRLRDRLNHTVSSEHFDVVVLATGYRRDAHHVLLDGLDAALGQTVEQCDVARDYQLVTPAHFQPRIYLQGCCEDSHGLSDTLLSVLARRADEIALSLDADEAVSATASSAQRCTASHAGAAHLAAML